MTFHLRNKNGAKELLTGLINFCGKSTVKIEFFDTFYHVEINTDYESVVHAYFTEKEYYKGEYGIRIYYTRYHEDDFFIPLEFIDCIYSL